jgi:hypothetical protein
MSNLLLPKRATTQTIQQILKVFFPPLSQQTFHAQDITSQLGRHYQNIY